MNLSLLIQERGLKSPFRKMSRGLGSSLLIQERGLKSNTTIAFFYYSNVAPYTGAWIEICQPSVSLVMPVVAPYTGAWIEI